MSDYIERLKRHTPLTEASRRAFFSLKAKQQIFESRRNVIDEGAKTQRLHIITEGFVCQYRTLPSGERQIVSFHLPNEIVDLSSLFLPTSDCGIRTHTRTRLVSFAKCDLIRIATRYPDIGRALWRESLRDAAICREWILNMGRRKPRPRLIHLLLELDCRFARDGRGNEHTFTLPTTQVDLADALGVSPVQVNRVLQALRAEHLIRTYGRTFVIENYDALALECHFRGAYLEPGG